MSRLCYVRGPKKGQEYLGGIPSLGSESIPKYVARRYDELVNSLSPDGHSVSNDAAGAFAASKLIFVEMKNNPSLVTQKPPMTARQVEDIINNPGNPISWLKQKASRAETAVSRSVKQNLDKPAKFLQAVDPFAAGNVLDYRKLAFLGAGALALYFLAPIAAASIFSRSRAR